jgi:hypothetical protein
MKKHHSPLLLLILALAVLLRVGVAVYLGNEVDAPLLLTDQRSYHALGGRLVTGHGFSFDENWYPFTLAETPTAHWSFLYSLFIAGVYATFGFNPLAARLVQAALGGVLLPWMVYRLTRTAFDPSPLGVEHSRILGLLAAFMTTVYAYYILFSATMMTETFFIVALLWSLERSIKLADRLRDPRDTSSLIPSGLVLGLSLGIATLLRQSILPWVPVLFLYLLWVGWRAKRLPSVIASLGLAGLVLVGCILPWTVRNYLVYDDFLLLNSNAGYAMYSAQHPMHGTSFREFDPAQLPDGIWGRAEPDMDRELMRTGIQFVLDNPVRYLLLSLSRVRAFFEFWPTSDTSLLHNVGRSCSFGLFLPFMLLGLFLTLRAPELRQRYCLVLLFAAFYTLLHLSTWAMVRYRLPVDATLIPLAALAVLDLTRRVRAAVPQRAA